MLQKSLTLTVDTIAYDLEDSVTLAQKPAARKHIRHILSQPRAPGVRENAVRINSVASGLALDDLREILPSPNLDAIVLPKCNSPSDLHFLADVIKHLLPSRHPSSPSPSSNPPPHNPPLHILALIESALALHSLPAICTSTPLSALIFAAEDFALDLSLTRTPSLTEFLYARSAIATAARAFNIPSTIDLVCTDYGSPAAAQILEDECTGGKGLGFNGKQVIHPSQLAIVQSAFSPSEKEVAWAVKVVEGDERAEREGRGAWTLEGKMIDAPVVGKARAIVERAGACGVDVGVGMEGASEG
ncbi:hypothetical protein MMC30_000051 [Trapelia coarctata]|nr:hypothetical protein [Trapelia coarctata]